MSTSYERINYYNDSSAKLTSTMLYLHWFRFFQRNSDDHIRVVESGADKQTDIVRLFFIMRSSEGTFVPSVYQVTAKKQLTYLQWCELIKLLINPIEREINRVLKLEMRKYLEWEVCEFIGWATDGLVQNPEEAKNAFCFAGHLTSTLD